MESSISDSRMTEERGPGPAARILGFMDGDGADDFRTIATFLTLLCLHVGLRHLHLGLRESQSIFLASGAIALAVAAGCAFESRRGRLRWSLPFGVGTVALFASHKPALGNHAALESLLLLAVALAVPVTAARAGTIAALFRWSCVLLFLHSGMQKIVYGAYFNGSFLARRIHDDRFAWVLDLALPKAEFAALQSADPLGPMVLESVGGLLLSNAVYLSEVGCALLLAIPSTRRLGLFASVLTVIGIEVVAREVGFGLTFILMLLLFRPQTYAGRGVVAFVIGAHLALGVTEVLAPGVLLW